MKEMLFLISFMPFLIYSTEKIYNLTKYGNLIYDDTSPSLTVLDTTDITDKEIEIIYTVQNNHENTRINYSFTNEFPNNGFTSNYYFFSSRNNSLDGKVKMTYNFQKREGKYLVLMNIICKDNEKIEVEHRKKDNTSLIIIIIISIIVVIGIIVGFIFIGKYIYNKRQKEIMGNYASSFVAENPSLVPNEEKEKSDNNNNIKIYE